MGIKSWLLGINPQKAFETISSGVDKLAFTKEERADLNVKLADKVSEFAEKTLGESTVRSKARRVIAYIVVITYIGILLSSVFINDIYLHQLAKDSAIQTAFIMVLAFFFGGYYLQSININKKKD